MISSLGVTGGESGLTCISAGGAEGQHCMVLVEWINTIVPQCQLSLKASEEELRVSLLDGVIMCQLLNKLKPKLMEEVDVTYQIPHSERLEKFLGVVANLGLPGFEISDLEKGSMKPVLECLSALKERCTPHCVVGEKFSYSPRSPSTTVSPGFPSSSRISESLKSNSLDNAPTQALVTLVNGILDETIERKNAEISLEVAHLLRKAVLEIERRISTQAEHLRTQRNLYKTREEKYQSRIRVLETLAVGTTKENEVVKSHLQHMKSERFKMEELKKTEDKEVARLMKEKDERDLELSTLKGELETLQRTYKEHDSNMETQSKRFKMEEIRKTEDKEVARLMKEKDQRDLELSTLKGELETLKRTYKEHYSNMETQSKLVKSELEQKLAEQQLILSGLENNMKQVKLEAELKDQKWEEKAQLLRSKINEQRVSLQELRNCSDFIKLDLVKTQTYYILQLNSLGEKMKILAKAAHRYHEVAEENRKIYNELQDLKGNIRVYCRVRPFVPGEVKKDTVVEYIGENGEMAIMNPSKGKDAQKAFKFNKVYDQIASQEDVYADTQPLIRTVLDGYNVCIFAYGQTGSGKTYTMMGPEGSDKNSWGVNIRALDDLFQVSENRKNYFHYEIGVQMVEIYNEQIRDLLLPEGSQKKLGVLIGAQPNGLAVPDASVHHVQSTSDVIELMNRGHTNRSVGATSMNERSSRSHSVVTVHVHGTDLISGASTRGCLHLVDLAGSERVERAEVTGDRLKEAQHINKSLSALGDVIYALAQKSPHIPYRNSKLTQVLQSYLGGGAKTLMFVQVNPDMNSYTETLSTLKFAERVSGIELGAAKSNRESRVVKELIDQVAHLKHDISKKDEEIDRLQNLKDPKNSNLANRWSDSSFRHGAFSSASTTSTSTTYSTCSGRGSTSFHKGGASDRDSCSEYCSCDRQSDTASHQFTGTDGRLSEVSDCDHSSGTEIDLPLETRKPPVGQKVPLRRREDAYMEPKKLPSPKKLLAPQSQKAAPTTSSRLPAAKSNPRGAPTVLKIHTNENSASSLATPGSSRKIITSGSSASSVTTSNSSRKTITSGSSTSSVATFNSSRKTTTSGASASSVATPGSSRKAVSGKSTSPATPGRRTATNGNSSTNNIRRWT